MRYDVNITRDGRWWMIEIPALDGLTQARRIVDARSMAREYIAVTLDVPLSTVELGAVLVIADGTDFAAVAESVKSLRERADAMERTASALMIKAAQELAAAEVPQRDIGALFGVTHQRVAQLVGQGPAASSRAVETQRSVGAGIRETIDHAFPTGETTRSQALEHLRSAPRLDIEDPSELRREIDTRYDESGR